MFDFRNQHVVVVGGSSGIGLAVAACAKRDGASVTVMGRSAARLEAAVANALGGAGKVAALAVDVGDEAAVQRAFAGIPPADHVYVAAGGFVGGGVFDADLPAMRAALETRVWGALHVVRAAAPRMRGPNGSIVLTGAISSERPAKGAWPTALATAATEQLARCLALELAPLRVNAIAPGWTDTPMWDDLLGAGKASTFAGVAARTPSGRLVTADEAAQAVLLLMANPGLNAEVLHVDGGLRLA